MPDGPEPGSKWAPPIRPYEKGKLVKFGAQAALCRRTLCGTCFARAWHQVTGGRPVDWGQLRELVHGERSSDAHHEPQGCKDDAQTMPLCWMHHTGGFQARHRLGRTDYYDAHGYQPEGLILEMQRRTNELAQESLG